MIYDYDEIGLLNVFMIVGLLAVMACSIFCFNKGEDESEIYYTSKSTGNSYGALEESSIPDTHPYQGSLADTHPYQSSLQDTHAYQSSFPDTNAYQSRVSDTQTQYSEPQQFTTAQYQHEETQKQYVPSAPDRSSLD